MKTKDFALQVKDLSDDGTFEGYGSVFGVRRQLRREASMPGAFVESLVAPQARGQSVLMLWQHDSWSPIGVWDDLAEDKRGLWGKGRLLLRHPEGARRRTPAQGGRHRRPVDRLSRDRHRPGWRGAQASQEARPLRDQPVSFPANRRARIESVKSERMEEFARAARWRAPPIKEFEDILREAGVPKAMAVQIASVGYAKAIRSESEGEKANDQAERS
jgi:hypothetical protein